MGLWEDHYLGSEYQFEQGTSKVEGGFNVGWYLYDDDLVGPFHLKDVLKINSQTYSQFLEDTFKEVSKIEENYELYEGQSTIPCSTFS